MIMRFTFEIRATDLVVLYFAMIPVISSSWERTPFTMRSVSWLRARPNASSSASVISWGV